MYNDAAIQSIQQNEERDEMQSELQSVRDWLNLLLKEKEELQSELQSVRDWLDLSPEERELQ